MDDVITVGTAIAAAVKDEIPKNSPHLFQVKLVSNETCFPMKFVSKQMRVLVNWFAFLKGLLWQSSDYVILVTLIATLFVQVITRFQPSLAVNHVVKDHVTTCDVIIA